MIVFVKPASGVKVRLPGSNKHVPADGISVEQTGYITRRIQDGSLIVAEKKTAPAPAPKKLATPAKEGDK